MHQQDIHFTYLIYDDLRGLTLPDQDLIRQAGDATGMAYAPYSKFNVGVAIRNTDHTITIGSNQENGSFPIGQCAERVALYTMVHVHGRKPIDAIAIVVDSPQVQNPVSPCGSCRQMINEYRRFQETPIRLLLTLATGGKVYEIRDIHDLLPLAFDGSFLGF